jgi:hypothetical protein
MSFEVFRREGNDLLPLELGTGGYFCSEGQTIVLRTLTPELPEVMLHGERLRAVSLKRANGQFIGEFERWIDTWAGRSRLVINGGITPETVDLDIGPPERKLGPGAWEALIQELSEISKSLPWGMSPGAAAGKPTPDALTAVHPAIIEHELPIFRRLLRQLLADPPTLTLRTRTIRRLDVSRGADLQTIRWLSRRPLELAGIRGMAAEGQAPNPRALADQPTSTTSFDHPITRYVAYLLEQIRRRLVVTATILRSDARTGFDQDATAATYAAQLAAEIDEAVVAIVGLQRAPVFRLVRPEPISDSVLQSLPDHPLYSAIHRVGRRLLDPGLAYAPGEDVYSALKRSYDLFELVVLYRLVAALGAGLGAEWHPTRNGTVQRLPLEDRPPDRSIWTWTGPQGQELSLCYQLSFGAAKPPPDLRKFHSLSATRIPDYVLVYSRNGSVESWIVLDAKYRSSQQSVQDGLGDVHRYRDSLRAGGRAASAAYIIVPRLHDSADLYGQPEFIAAHKLGALSVYAASWMEPIWSWLRAANSADLVSQP